MILTSRHDVLNKENKTVLKKNDDCIQLWHSLLMGLQLGGRKSVVHEHVMEWAVDWC